MKEALAGLKAEVEKGEKADLSKLSGFVEDIETASAADYAQIKKLERKVSAVGNKTPEELDRLEDKVTELSTANEELARKLSQAEKVKATTEKTLSEKLTAKSGIIQKLIRDDGLLKGLTESGVKKELLAGALALHAGKVEVDEEKGEAFAMVNGARTALPDYLKAWAASDEGKHYIAAPVNGGGGASGPGSAIPGTKTLSRSAFDALDPVAKTTFAKEGGKLTD